MNKILLILALSLGLFGEDILNKSLVTLEGTSISIMFIVKFVLIFVVGFGFGWFYKNKIIRSHKLDDKLSSSTKTILGNLGYYTIIFLTIVTAFNSIGLDLSSLAVVAGALSVGIGFGLQTIVSNFISGIILMFEKSVKVGDYVELENGVRGTVSEIRLRATIVTTNEHIDVIVPNSNFIQNSVTNLTLNDEVLRLRIPFGVAYGTEVSKVQEVVLNEILNDSTLPHMRNNPELLPRVWMVAMNSSSVDFELVLWVEGDDTRKALGIQSTYLIKIYETLNKNNIIIPFPQLDLHIKRG